MSTDKRLLPEEQELEAKRGELEEKQSLVADRELELVTARSRLIAFEQLYMEKVGRLVLLRHGNGLVGRRVAWGTGGGRSHGSMSRSSARNPGPTTAAFVMPY